MRRYAIYYVPPAASALWRLGSALLGYDSVTGREVPFPSHPWYVSPTVRAWTEEPRRYGFHGTLVAPFEPAIGVGLADVADAVRRLVRGRPPFLLPRLEVRAVRQFVALVSTAPCPALDALAGDLVGGLDRLRAPPSDADRARRLASPLTARQRELLDLWGYPYVLDEFSFHITLTTWLPAGEVERARQALDELHAPLAGPVEVADVALLEQPARDQRFVVRERIPFME
jgi:putative phosphonate metabolism protein